jgi:hypothetical protein
MRYALLAILVFWFASANAQQPTTSAWYGIRVPVNINTKWQLVNDAGYRTIDYSASAYQYLFRTGVRYFINNYWGVGTGIAIFETRTSAQKSNPEFGNEFRLWQELSYRKNFTEKTFIQNQFRTEERFYAATHKTAAYNAIRLRNRVAATKMFNSHWGLQLAEEYMQQYDHKHFSFNQNRVAASGLLNFNKTTQLSGGYMWLLRPGLSQHIVMLGFQKTLSFHTHG